MCVIMSTRFLFYQVTIIYKFKFKIKSNGKYLKLDYM